MPASNWEMVRQPCGRKVVHWTNGRRYADAISYAYSYADHNPHTDADTCSNGDADTHAGRDTDSNSRTNGHTYTHSNCYTLTNRHAYSDADAVSNTRTNSQPPSTPAQAQIRPLRNRADI